MRSWESGMKMERWGEKMRKGDRGVGRSGMKKEREEETERWDRARERERERERERQGVQFIGLRSSLNPD